MEKEKSALNRREFLKKAGIGTGLLLGGSYLIEKIDEGIKEYYEYRIYNELNNYVHMAELDAKVMFSGKEFPVKKKGRGIIIGDKYLTVAHITDVSTVNINGATVLLDVLEKKVSLYGETLEELVFKPINDVAIYKIPKKLVGKLKSLEFPCKPTDDISLGDKVFIVGDPYLGGENTRPAKISELQCNKHLRRFGERKSFFGYECSSFPGDSGSPVVNENFELIGLVSSGLVFTGGSLNYAKRISEFGKEIDKIETENFLDKIIKKYSEKKRMLEKVLDKYNLELPF